MQRGRVCTRTTFAGKDRIGDRWRVRNTYICWTEWCGEESSSCSSHPKSCQVSHVWFCSFPFEHKKYLFEKKYVFYLVYANAYYSHKCKGRVRLLQKGGPNGKQWRPKSLQEGGVKHTFIWDMTYGLLTFINILHSLKKDLFEQLGFSKVINISNNISILYKIS
jgi:hypothetical protein